MKTALYIAIGLIATAHAKTEKPKEIVLCNEPFRVDMKAYDDYSCKTLTKGVGSVSMKDVQALLDDTKCNKHTFTKTKKDDTTEYYKGQCDTETKKDAKGKDV